MQVSKNPASICPARSGLLARVTSDRPVYSSLKRLADIVLSISALFLLAPVFLAAAIAIKLDSEGTVFYSQIRIGKARQPFVMYKFRSMCQDADKCLGKLYNLNERDGPAFKIDMDPRVTRVGRFLRKTCIDELPQLINVIKGDMSIVGPRPPLPGEVELYSPHHFSRLEALPGLTCYWQISDKSMSFDRWVEMDVEYIRSAGMLLDIKLILRTVAIVFCGGAGR